MGGGTSNAASGGQTNLSPQQMIDIYNKALPVSLSTILNQAPSGVNTLANAATLNNPIFTAGTLDQLNQYGGGYQQAGANLAQQQAGSTANLLQGQGANAAFSADALNRGVNQNYYKVQDASSEQAKNLVNSVNLNGLSPGEQNSVERSLNQSNTATGNLGLDNATNAVSNAVNFGGAFNSKLGILGNALGAANNTANTAQNTGFNAVGTALNAGNTSNNFALGQFNPNQATPLVNIPTNTAVGFGSQLAGNTNATKSGSGSESANGGICCFIFMEAYYGNMPLHVRKCRDRYYRVLPEVATGYKKMAKWLVPLMRRFWFVRQIVWHTMVKPLTDYGAFVTRQTSKCRGRLARKFWFTIWKNI